MMASSKTNLATTTTRIFMLLVLVITISNQINQVNTLPAFLYNFATSLTSTQQTTTPQPQPQPQPQELPKPQSVAAASPVLSHNNNNNNNKNNNNNNNNINNNINQNQVGGDPLLESAALGVLARQNAPSLSSGSGEPQVRQEQQLSGPINSVADQQQQQQMIQKAANGLQQQLSALQNQAQKQLAGQNQKFHMLEVLSNMGKAIQQQLMSNNNGNIQIITSPAMAPANNKKNEYQATVEKPLAPSLTATSNYREQGEQIRQDIVRRAGQLQQVLSSSMDAIKDKGDVIVKRLLEQLNSRLDQAKSKADKIINEPATNEVAIKTLNAINQGLHNLNNIITNIVNRFDLTASKDASASQKIAAGLAILNGPNGAEKLRQQLGASAATKPQAIP